MNVEDMSPPGERRRLAAQRVVEDRAFQLQQMDQKFAEDAARERALFAEHEYLAEHGVPRPGALQQAMQADERPERDASAPPGSERNPVVLY